MARVAPALGAEARRLTHLRPQCFMRCHVSPVRAQKTSCALASIDALSGTSADSRWTSALRASLRRRLQRRFDLSFERAPRLSPRLDSRFDLEVRLDVVDELVGRGARDRLEPLRPFARGGAS